MRKPLCVYSLLPNHIMKYDCIIIGGGLAGLYTAYRLIQSDPNQKIVILERNRKIGGRIDTINGLEAGAGRFSNKHTRLLGLIDELGLSPTITPIANFEFYMENGTKHSWKPIYDMINKIANACSDPPNDVTFLHYANTIPGVSTDILLDFYGYSSELTDMNARDAIALMKRHFNRSVQYFTMNGGLSQITRELAKRLKNVQMITHRRVNDIEYNDNHEFVITCDGINRKYISDKCICAVTKDTLLKWHIFKPIYPMLRLIKTLPLCRIYAKVPGLGNEKITVNNKLRIIIPIDEASDTVMMSYTDNKYARYWKKQHETKGMGAVNLEHQRLLNETFHRDDIPVPRNTQIYYWEHGVAYFAPGFDSKTMPARIMRPFADIPLFICGENYSEKNNQWMEGALDTSDYILNLLDR